MPANYVLLNKVTLGATAASVTFSNIPQTGYTDLKVVASARGTQSSVNQSYKMTFNGTSTTGLSMKRLYGDGASAASDSGLQNIEAVGATATSSTFSNDEIYIPNYTSANYKSYSIDNVGETNAATAYAILHAGLWSNTAAITSIVFTGISGSFVQYSTFYLYGLAAVGTTPVIAPFATGGDIIQNDGTYWIHTFLSSGTFTPQKALTCDYLVVAGGGGGGYYAGGGGGAGGFRTSTALSTPVAAYSITVGAGGAGAFDPSPESTKGNNSVFSTITSTGGGNGPSGTGNGVTGGSGAGGAANGSAGTGGAGNQGGYSPVEGYAGGNGYFLSASSTANRGGGGGGSSAVGANGTANTNAAGGAGTSNSYSGSAVTYAAGGGSSGNASSPTVGTSASANTGNGGQAGSYAASQRVGGNGGSGIVIIRYPIA